MDVAETASSVDSVHGVHGDVTPLREEIVRCVPCHWNLTDIR